MGYRGHDLDLRTPQTWRASTADFSGAASSIGMNGPGRTAGYGAEQEIPIWVDDTVLACCNHAFDVALAHRSGEVRIEHLLHALTRIDDAAEILESNGIRAAALRRETATVIASEIPVTMTNGTAMPRRADSFEEVLRLAAAHAYQRNAPVNIDDLLYVFLDMRPQIPGIELIEHHVVTRGRERAQPALRRPPANRSYAPPLIERREYEPRERVRRPAGRYFVGETPPAQSAPPVSSGSVQAATDHLQNSRLDALEQLVRSISSDITGQRDDTSRFSGGVFDRLQSLETTFLSRPEGDSSNIDLGPVVDRLEALERKLSELANTSVDVDTRQIEQRIEAMERELAGQLSDRLDRVDKALETSGSSAALAEMSARLELIEEAVLGRDGAMSGDVDSRLTAVSEAVSLHNTVLDDMRAQVVADVRDVNATLHEQSTRIARTGEALSEIVRAVESLRDEERNTLAQVSTLVGGYQTDVEGFVSQANDVMETHNSELKEVHSALMKLNSNQHTLAGSIDQWRSDGSGDLAIIASRIESLEKEAARPMALLQSLNTNMDTMHRLTVERYHRRNRFWYWLFGTDDWVAASWPSQSSRIERERQALREAHG